jgi:hypothetical protein
MAQTWYQGRSAKIQLMCTMPHEESMKNMSLV